MRLSVSNKLALCRSLLYCLFVWLLPALSYADTPVLSAAEGFGVEVKNAEITLKGDNYMLSADIDYQLSARAMEALQSGVPLFWDIHIKTIQRRDFLWDKTLINAAIRYRIQYHALLNMYRVRNESSGATYNFSTLSAAFDLMSAIYDFPVMYRARYKQGERYAVEIKVTLDRDALPLPLRPVAYTNPQWYLSSDWTLWPLTK
ncbi:DUF4390 domain-containing protein [Methylobacter sp.]|uniref:DUF4390 domain-containing protein n=1 Tax=Methylobacter sp. TaxID=2051955 RepID=UPI0012033399|nr:DUF4390 domain-containing protein [Methylobacter sp.]TAK62295.1 MAG: DUF4390 domain-containing protein [Methylobacter sp.]